MVFNLKKKDKQVPENMNEVVNEILLLKKKNKELEEKIERLEKEKELCLQGWEMIRFNPFQDEGGKQSFSLALLDGKSNGMVVTALYTKEGSRVYGKPVKKGFSEYSLSEEEKKAIAGAVEKMNNNG